MSVSNVAPIAANAQRVAGEAAQESMFTCTPVLSHVLICTIVGISNEEQLELDSDRWPIDLPAIGCMRRVVTVVVQGLGRRRT